MDTSYVDPVFPLPEPDFLWAHSLVAWSSASVVVGRARKWRTTSASAAFDGYATAPSPRELRRADREGYVVDAVALAPHGATDLDEDGTLEVTPGSGAPPVLVGRYTVRQIRPNPSHVRYVLTRVRGEGNPPHAG
jgi:hypothetical protein